MGLKSLRLDMELWDCKYLSPAASHASRVFMILNCLFLTPISSAFYGPTKPDNERLALLDSIYELGEWHWDSGLSF
jgi:hypothetical protein